MMSPPDPRTLAAVRVVAEAHGGHPPSLGAHRLAWWLGTCWGGQPLAAHFLAKDWGLSADFIERLLMGEVEPTGDIAEQIAASSSGAIPAQDWFRGGPLGWMDFPPFAGAA
ncbi:MAG: hypothetical protein CMN73_04235 [Sphingomonas sp.]|nr:hypothetical protein [Sphingomonas sp.]